MTIKKIIMCGMINDDIFDDIPQHRFVSFEHDYVLKFKNTHIINVKQAGVERHVLSPSLKMSSNEDVVSDLKFYLAFTATRATFALIRAEGYRISHIQR